VLLRYLLYDHVELAEKAREIITQGTFSTPEVLAEVVYVLQSVYKIDRETIRDRLTNLLTEVSMPLPELYAEALASYAQHRLDFVDAILLSRARLLGEELFTFDKKLDRLYRAQ